MFTRQQCTRFKEPSKQLKKLSTAIQMINNNYIIFFFFIQKYMPKKERHLGNGMEMHEHVHLWNNH